MQPKRMNVAKSKAAKSSTNLVYIHRITITGKKKGVCKIGNYGNCRIVKVKVSYYFTGLTKYVVIYLKAVRCSADG